MSSSLLPELEPTADTSPGIAARASSLNETYGAGETAAHALAGVDVAFTTGRFAAIMGPSGSGKSTLMYLMAAVDVPASGTVIIGDTDVTALSK